MSNKQDRKTQRLFNNVTKSLLTQNNGLKRDPETGVLYEEPLKDEHPGLDLALMYAQPGNIIAKTLAPSMAKGMVEGIRNGNAQQALLSMLIPEGNITKSLIDLDKLGKTAKITLSDPEKYWYVAHQTGSANFPKIMKSGLQTTNGLNGTALHLTEDYANVFGKGLLKKNHLSHEGADGMIIMKFPKSKFPSGDLDDISIRLMELGESKNFEVPIQYLTFIKKTQLKQGGILKAQDGTPNNGLPPWIKRDDSTRTYITAFKPGDKNGRTLLRNWQRGDGKQLIRDSSLVKRIGNDGRYIYIPRSLAGGMSGGFHISELTGENKDSDEFIGRLRFVGMTEDGLYEYYDPLTGQNELYDTQFENGGKIHIKLKR